MLAVTHQGASCDAASVHFCLTKSDRYLFSIIHRLMLFSYRATLCYCAICCVYMCVRPSARLSVCLSVTSWRCTKMAKRMITQTTPYDSVGTIVVWRQKSWRKSDALTPNKATNRGGIGSDRRFSTSISLYLTRSSATAEGPRDALG